MQKGPTLERRDVHGVLDIFRGQASCVRPAMLLLRADVRGVLEAGGSDHRHVPDLPREHPSDRRDQAGV